MQLQLGIESFLMIFLNGGGVILGLIIAILLFSRKEGAQKGNKIFALLTFLTSLTLLNNLLAESGVYSQHQYPRLIA